LQALLAIAVSLFEKEVQKKRDEGMSLIICPASLLSHWEEEIRKFFPATVFEPMIYPTALPPPMEKTNEEGPSPHRVVIASYDMVRRDRPFFTGRLWEAAVLDEAHSIRNPLTATSKAIFDIQAKFRMLLTGTPIQNQVAWRK
jgi:TATA-binding protein-associated factor